MIASQLQTWKRLVTVEASRSLSGTFLRVAQAAVSTPLTATEVVAPWLMALKAYSTWARVRLGDSG